MDNYITKYWPYVQYGQTMTPISIAVRLRIEGAGLCVPRTLPTRPTTKHDKDKRGSAGAAPPRVEERGQR